MLSLRPGNIKSCGCIWKTARIFFNILYLVRAKSAVPTKEVSFLFHLVDVTGRHPRIFKSLLVLILLETDISFQL